ncbi:hypothetical protein [Methanoculleus sp. UBA303]|jgi:hypothetical protein|uniref:hypothetical protein n=1 Tax=Methanoculleus sp. UBA303 TaxID=1915497 RepID=UPI0025CE6164|nr:hypothetical protein [Methanoculleus sp. UBA303]
MTTPYPPSKRDDLARFYVLIDELKDRLGGYRYLSRCHDRMDWPRRGVYFFFEPGEVRFDGTALRVVRVGTHAIATNTGTRLWRRLATHRGTRSGGGNHRGSVFRKLVGAALIHRGDYPASATALWGIGNTTRREAHEREWIVERDVSEYIGRMPFLWLPVDDEPGPESDRKVIEKNAIALLSAVHGSPDHPSETWLGHACPHPDMRASALWNSDHVREPYDPAFLDLFEGYVSSVASSGSPLSDESLEIVTQRHRSMDDEQHADHLWLATVTLRSDTFKYPNNDPEKNRAKNEDRFTALTRIITDLAASYSGPGVVVFPGGYFHSGTDEVDAQENSYLQAMVDRVAGLLNALPHHPAPIYATIGIDGKVDVQEGDSYRYDRNQVGIAVTRDGLVAFAKKFYPTDDREKNLVDLAESYSSRETALGQRWDRVFSIGKQGFYLAICNDIKGLPAIEKPDGVAYILNLVHGCYRPGEGPKCTYFVRMGFGGASRSWKCPVFGTVVFFQRDIAEKWRPGMYYRTWDKMPIQCTTDENSTMPEHTLDLIALADGYARVDVYDLDTLPAQAAITSEICRERSKIPVRSSTPQVREPDSILDERYNRLLSALTQVFGNTVMEQKTKNTIRGKNVIGYPGKQQIDMISLFKPGKQSGNGIRFRMYTHLIAAHLNTGEKTIAALLPQNSVYGEERENPHIGEIFQEGSFKTEGEVEAFLTGVQELHGRG